MLAWPGLAWLQYAMVGECELYKTLGQRHPPQACFIHCSQPCRWGEGGGHTVWSGLVHQTPTRIRTPMHAGHGMPTSA